MFMMLAAVLVLAPPAAPAAASGPFLPGSGHWLIDEAPAKVIPELAAFLDASSASPAP
jgi:pimeloyl-ACP methyl ester carboxylesterase